MGDVLDILRALVNKNVSRGNDMLFKSVNDHILQTPIEEIRLIARSTCLPVNDRELLALGAYIDAYEAERVSDFALYVQARVKARAYIAQRLTERIRWDSGQDGAIGAMTAKLRRDLMTAA
jgi:hypothetical protein